MKEIEKYFLDFVSKFKKNKLFFIFFLIILLFIGYISYIFFSGFMEARIAKPEYLPAYAPLEGVKITPFEREVEERAAEILKKQEEYKIKRGFANIKSADAVSDYEKIKEKAESLQGWVESMSKSEDYLALSIRANLKIPFENFDPFVDWLMDNFDVKSANFEMYRESVERMKDEIDILLMALSVYDRLLERVEQMNVSETSIELTMRITQRKLDTMRLLRQYGYSIEQVEKKAKYASLSLTITQEKHIKLLPEDLGSELRSKLRNSVREIIEAGMNLLTVPAVIFVKVIVYIIYAIIVILPVFIAIKLVLRFLKLIGKKIK